jgi:hypothetical protein
VAWTSSVGLTTIGRVTAEVLEINLRHRLVHRHALVEGGVFPPAIPSFHGPSGIEPVSVVPPRLTPPQQQRDRQMFHRVLRSVRLGTAVAATAFICLGLGLALADEAAPDEGQERKRVLVPPRLPGWQLSVTSKSRPHVFSGHVRVGANRIMKIGKQPDPWGSENDVAPDRFDGTILKLTEKEASDFFADVAATVNGFYFCTPDGRDPEYHHSARYRIRVESATRAVTIAFEQNQPGRMRLQADLGRVVAAIDEGMERTGWTRKGSKQFPKPFDLNARYHDERAANHSTIVPVPFEKWQFLGVRIISESEKAKIFLSQPTGEKELNSRVGMGVIVEPRKRPKVNDNRQEDRVETIGEADHEMFVNCVRTIVNEFTLSDARRLQPGENDGPRIEVEISTGPREIVVEFSSRDDIPAEWREHLTKVIDLANGIIKPGHKRIAPL